MCIYICMAILINIDISIIIAIYILSQHILCQTRSSRSSPTLW